jgi:hypothetical protein
VETVHAGKELLVCIMAPSDWSAIPNSLIADMESFQCRTVDAIYFGKGKKPWDTPNDKKFICIHKWDAGFVKFATGKSMERRKDKPSTTGNFGVLDEIKKLRYETCNAKMQAIMRIYVRVACSV